MEAQIRGAGQRSLRGEWDSTHRNILDLIHRQHLGCLVRQRRTSCIFLSRPRLPCRARLARAPSSGPACVEPRAAKKASSNPGAAGACEPMARDGRSCVGTLQCNGSACALARKRGAS
eukprot:6974670-Pyramimonas_sp.AAC.1